jgi:transcriptional regulator with XRE-family HTH domain
MARPRIDIDIDRVAELAGRGLTQAEICAVLGVSEDTISRRKQDTADFADAINRGRATAAQEVSNALYEKATVDKDLGAIIWYEKTRRGLSDRVQQHITFDVSKLSDDELRRIAEGQSTG